MFEGITQVITEVDAGFVFFTFYNKLFPNAFYIL